MPAWYSDDYPDHEGYVVGHVRREGSSLFRELSRDDGEVEHDRIVRIQVACSCGWRSPYEYPWGGRWTDPGTSQVHDLPRYSPGMLWLTEEDEERCRQAWVEHAEAATAL